MGSQTVSFSSDDPDDIAYVVAFWNLIQDECQENDPPWVVVDNYCRLLDIVEGRAREVYEFSKTWDTKVAEQVLARFPGIDK